MKGLTILFLLICPFCWSQTELEIPPHPPIPKELGPPVQAEGPSKENMVLIDSLLNVCKFEQDFIAICEMSKKLI